MEYQIRFLEIEEDLTYPKDMGLTLLLFSCR